MKVHFISRLAFIAFVGLALLPLCRAQSQLVGEWQGTVKAGNTQLRVTWHVVAAKDGTITSTIDNLDQKIYGLPVSSMTVKGDTLTLTLDTVRVLDGDTINIRGTFTGTINADATEIHGSWFQGQTLELDLKRVPAQADPGSSEPKEESPLTNGPLVGSCHRVPGRRRFAGRQV